MATLAYSITSLGLELPVLIGLDSVALTNLRAAGKPIPRPSAASALIDTGCNVSSVDSALLQRIGAIPTGHGSTITAGGSQNINLFRVSLSIPSQQPGMFVLPSLMVLELATSIPQVDLLLGGRSEPASTRRR